MQSALRQRNSEPPPNNEQMNTVQPGVERMFAKKKTMNETFAKASNAVGSQATEFKTSTM